MPIGTHNTEEPGSAVLCQRVPAGGRRLRDNLESACEIAKTD